MGRRLLIARLVRHGAIVSGLGLWLRPSPAAAQISPGPLSRSHAALEGNSHCAACHDVRRGLASSKCLACHRALQERRAAGLGLHARPTHGDCRKCHVEHQGLDYDLVWWGKEGREAFDHREAGFALEGKHARIRCEGCHQPRFTKRTFSPTDGVDRGRTYLGLAPSCVACHEEKHRATRFAGRSCASCHSFEAWKSPSRFDHAKTRYPLTGAHATAACARCHAVKAGDGPVRPADRRPSARECASCHADVHEGKLGPACASCHSTAGWRRSDRAAFDHARTGYALRGRHASVACEACHPPGRPLRKPHERCTDCHADAHLGQLQSRSDQGRCESCHDVSGFSPPTFTVEAHEGTRFPLKASHLAVACSRCHRRVPAQSLEAVIGPRPPGAAGLGPRPTTQLRFAETRCASCHKDPHGGEVDRQVKAQGCESCHRVAGWREIAFDHDQTRFALAGGHAGPACVKCHEPTRSGGRTLPARFRGTPLACEACHHDPHRGQFADRRRGACLGCHARADVKVSLFDHDRDSRFRLEGAHARVACAACHRREDHGGTSFVRYKPLARACKDCHAAAAVGPRPAS